MKCLLLSLTIPYFLSAKIAKHLQQREEHMKNVKYLRDYELQLTGTKYILEYTSKMKEHQMVGGQKCNIHQVLYLFLRV